MTRLRWMTALVAGITLLLAGHVSVVAQSAGLDGAVHRGTCDSLAAAVSDLTPSVLGTGDRRGSQEAIPAASSFSTIPLSLDALLTDNHVVTASEPSGDVVACGEVGGIRGDGGALIIGLRPIEGSAVNGIAYLAPSGDPAQTDVSLFVAGETLEEMASAEVEEVAQEIPEAIVEGGGVDVLLTPLPVAESEETAPVAEQTTGFTAEELAYADAVVRITASMSESLDHAATLMQNPRIGQNDWTVEVVTQFFIWTPITKRLWR